LKGAMWSNAWNCKGEKKMTDQIAVCVSDKGETAALFKAERIVVFEKKQGSWTAMRGIELTLDNSLGMRELRARIDTAISLLADCRILVGLSIVGLPYFVLEKSGFSLWEVKGRPVEFLDYILEREKETRAAETKNQQVKVLPFPVETANGCYRISLKEIQANNVGVTSKQVLLPFLRQAKFYSLEVLCSHVLPWLEVELAGGTLAWVTETIAKDEIKITITPKCCHDESSLNRTALRTQVGC